MFARCLHMQSHQPGELIFSEFLGARDTEENHLNASECEEMSRPLHRVLSCNQLSLRMFADQPESCTTPEAEEGTAPNAKRRRSLNVRISPPQMAYAVISPPQSVKSRNESI